MKKQIILLATSRKYGKYCVAGLDTGNGKLVRLITNDSGSHYAIDQKQMTYMDGTVARKLDLTEIELSDRSVSYFQNEKFIILNGIPWLKLGTYTMDDVLRIHPLNQC